MLFLPPQMVEDFTPGKDYDPERERAQQRQLQKKINREKRGAMQVCAVVLFFFFGSCILLKCFLV